MNAERHRARATLQFENDRVKVREWRFAPNTETGPHRHEHDFVVVPLNNGTLTLISEEGRCTVELKTGCSYFREKGIEHNAVNESNREVALLEIDVKTP